MRLPNFCGPSYTSESPIADNERTINWYPESIESPAGKNRTALYPTPGQSSLMTVADVGTRALFAMNARTHAVVGTGVYEIFPSGGTSTKRGTIAQDNNPAQISYNGPAGNRLAIASGGTLSYVNLTTNVVSTVSGVSALQVGMLDGYFVAFDATTPQIRISPLNDGAGTWDPTQFAQRSIAPDPWKAMVTADRLGTREIWLIGEQTGEVWYDAGSFPFPFAPVPGAIFRYGTPAPWSLAVVGSLVIWLSQNADGAGQVVSARGYSPQVISDKSLENAIAGYQRTATITDAEAITFQMQGHTFYVLKFPSANATHVYDVTTQRWFDMGTWNANANRYDAWKPRVHTYTGGMHLVGESGTAQISSLDVTYGSEADGSPIRRLRRAQGLYREDDTVTYKRLQLKLESGLGLITGQGSNPIVMLRTSDDGGKTWSRERQSSAGAIGTYDTRVFWTRLGTARDRVFEVSVSDPVPWRLIDAYVNNLSANHAEQAA